MTPLSTRQLGEVLGVSQRRVFSLLSAYEAVFGNLPRDKDGVRLFSQEALERLRRARDMVLHRRASSYRAAFLQLVKAEEDSPLGSEDALRLLQALLDRVGEFPALLALVRHMRKDLDEVRREVAEIRLILHASGFENMARQDAEANALLGTPSLLKGRAQEASPPSASAPSSEEKGGEEKPKKIPWYRYPRG